MPDLSIATYLFYAYVVLPSLSVLYTSRYQICPLIKCISPLAKCLREPQCKEWLDLVAECTDSNSKARRTAATTFSHLQHPTDPAYCRYLSFDQLESNTALEFLECIGKSGCLEPSEFTDECASIPTTSTLPFETVEPVLAGTWKKLFTTGWDQWPCQTTTFYPPFSKEIPPESWMKSWPHASSVWRMDLWWQNAPTSTVKFHMNNEMYPHETWHFDDQSSTTTNNNATLKTKAVMWGTEAHENWYLLDYDATIQTMLVYYCAHTAAVHRYDSMAMVMQKEGHATLTEDQAMAIQQKAVALLGDKHGRLQRIDACR